MDFCGYDADDSANFIFQWIGPTDTLYLPPHDHRDNYNGGFSFAVYHPGTGIPQRPWSQ